MTDACPILFYSTSEEFGEFSNFASFPIKIAGKVWPTSEHYFQAQKFTDTHYAEAIRRAKSPMVAARLGRDRKMPLRKDWESVKIGIMRQAVEAKFKQHSVLRELLLSTENRRIIEHTTNDHYWGDGGDGSGKNMLGKILMDIRANLRNGNG